MSPLNCDLLSSMGYHSHVSIKIYVVRKVLLTELILLFFKRYVYRYIHIHRKRKKILRLLERNETRVFSHKENAKDINSKQCTMNISVILLNLMKN